MIRRLLPLLLVLMLAGSASAIELRKTSAWVVPVGQTISNELWLAADAVKCQGTVERALFIETQAAEFTGQFHRDVWALADTVVFSGQADQALRVAVRRSAQIAGRVDGGLLALGETVQIQKTAQIGEDAVLFGQDILFEGAVSNRLVAFGSKVSLAGHVGGSARVLADEISLLAGTIIEGDLIYTGDKDLIVPDQVKIKGKLIHQAKPNLGFALPQLTPAQQAFIQFALFLAALFVGLPFVALFPRFTTRTVALLRAQPNKCLLVGAITLALLPMLGVMSAMTWIGLPLGLLLLGTFLALLYLSKIMVAIPLAGRLLTLRGRSTRPLAALPVLVLGLFLLYLGVALPIVGFAVWLVILLYGMGAMVLALLSGEKGLPVILLADRPAEPPPLNDVHS